MSNVIQSSNFEIEPFEDRIDHVFRELELAIKWQRPSVLYAIYKSEYVRDEVKTALSLRFEQTDQKVTNLDLQSDTSPDINALLRKFADPDNSIVFVNGLNNVFCKDEATGVATPNIQEEFFVENDIRIVYWLTEEEAADLARTAPDYWSFRHRVFDFTDDPTPEQVIKSAFEKVWNEAESSESSNYLDELVGQNEPFLSDQPTTEETITFYGNLLLKLGILHWRKQDYEKAYDHLQIALDIARIIQDNDFGAECLYAIALVNTGLGKEKEAIHAYEVAIDLAPDQKLPWNTLGHLYIRLDRDSEAHTAFQRAIEENPKDPISWNGLGSVLTKIERFEDAISAFQKAIEFAPNFVHPWNGLGDVYTATGKVDDAIVVYENAIRLNNRLINPWIRLGNIFKKQKRIQDAIHAFEKAIEIDEKSFHAWNDLGDIYLKTELYDDAVGAYSKAIQLAPNFGWPYRNLASAYISKDLFSEAVPLLLKSIDLLQSNSEKALSFGKLGDTYRHLGDYQNALEAYQQADVLSAELSDQRTRTDLVRALTAADFDPIEPQLEAVPATTELVAECVEPEVNAALKIEMPVAAEEISAPAPVMDSSEEQARTSVVESALTIEQTPDANEEPPVIKPVAEHAVQGGEDIPSKINTSPAGSPDEKKSTFDAEITREADKSASEWNGLGNTHLKAGSYDDAITAYTKAIEHAESVYWPYIHNLALAHYQKGRYITLSKANFSANSPIAAEQENVEPQKEERNLPWQVTTQQHIKKQPRNTKNRPNPNYLLARARFLLASNSRG